jgi:hypothetical protein
MLRECLLLDLICVQGDVDLEEEIKDTARQDPSSSEENNEALEWHTFVWSGRCAPVCGRTKWLIKTPAFNISENSQRLDFLLLCFQAVLPVIVHERNCCMEEHAEARNKPHFPDSHKISVKNLYVYTVVIFQMGHDHELSMRLCWTKDEFSCIPFYSSMMPHDCLF